MPFHGVLAKYVNLTTGYRPRYFVLMNGVLVYYKINHDHQVTAEGAHRFGVLGCARNLTIDSYTETESGGTRARLRHLSEPHRRGCEGFRRDCQEARSRRFPWPSQCSSRVAAALHGPPLPWTSVLNAVHPAHRRKAEGAPVTTPRPVVQGVLHLQVCEGFPSPPRISSTFLAGCLCIRYLQRCSSNCQFGLECGETINESRETGLERSRSHMEHVSCQHMVDRAMLLESRSRVLALFSILTIGTRRSRPG